MSFVIALAAGLLLTPAAILLGARTGLEDRPVDPPVGDTGPLLKIHSRPISQLGGVAAVLAVLGGLWAAGEPTSPAVVAIVVGVTAIGVVDDAAPLPASLRALALVAAGACVALAGLTVESLGALGGVAAAVAVFASANAVNLLDGQDGLAGGVAVSAALGLAAVAVGTRTDPALPLSLAGALLAFVWWNREPARVFLGNGGAYGVGVLLAIGGIEVADAGAPAFAAVVICMAVFEFELGLTVVRRLWRGARVTEGDRGHSYDVLAERLGSRRRSTMWFCAAAAVCAGLAALVVSEA